MRFIRLILGATCMGIGILGRDPVAAVVGAYTLLALQIEERK